MLVPKKLKLIFIFFLSSFLLSCQNNSKLEQIEFGSHEYFLNEFGGIYENSILQNYITTIGKLISNSMKLNEHNLNFYVLNSPTLNIFSANKKNIYITRGIIILCNNESELASLIAHQLGHIKANHDPTHKKNYISWNKNISKYTETKNKKDSINAPLKIRLPYYNHFQENEANKISIDALNKISFSFNDYVEINKSVKKLLKYKSSLYSWKNMKYDVENVHPSSTKDLKKLFNKFEGKRQKNPIKGRYYFLKKIDGTIFGNLNENKIIVKSPKKNESFNDFTQRNGITKKKSKELFMILNGLTQKEFTSKKKLKIIKEIN